jgi:hypothetical protein
MAKSIAPKLKPLSFALEIWLANERIAHWPSELIPIYEAGGLVKAAGAVTDTQGNYLFRLNAKNVPAVCFQEIHPTGRKKAEEPHLAWLLAYCYYRALGRLRKGAHTAACEVVGKVMKRNARTIQRECATAAKKFGVDFEEGNSLVMRDADLEDGAGLSVLIQVPTWQEYDDGATCSGCGFYWNASKPQEVLSGQIEMRLLSDDFDIKCAKDVEPLSLIVIPNNGRK